MLEIHTPSQPNRQEAFWYYGKHIATYTLADGTQLVLETSGEIDAVFILKGDGSALKTGDAAIHQAIAFDWKDEDLSNEEKVIFSMNNFFAIRKLEPNSTEGPDDDLAICHTYSEGMLQLIDEAAKIL